MIAKRLSRTIWIILAAIVATFAVALLLPRSESKPIPENVASEETFEIVSLLPRDAIPAIDNPEFVSRADADAIYHPDELVLGVEIDGDARAYSIPFLSGHEIVNDEVGGAPIAVTW